MADARVQIFNLALSAVGTRASISHPDEQSREAEICLLWYETVRDSVLRSAPWASARRTARLALKRERDFAEPWQADDPEPPWRFAYAPPANFLFPRYLHGFHRFAMATDSTNSHVIYTDVRDPLLTFTFRQTTIGMWDANLREAIIYALAAHIAMALHGKPDRAQQALERANMMILQAREADANSAMEQYEASPEWILARGSAFATTPQPFLYPYGPSLVLPGMTPRGYYVN